MTKNQLITTILAEFNPSFINNMLNENKVKLLQVNGKTDIIIESIVAKRFYIFKKAIEYGFPIDDTKFSYVNHIIRNGNIDYLKILFEHTKNKNYHILMQEKPYGQSALHMAILEGIPEDFIIYLSNNGANWNAQNVEGDTPLHLYIKSVPIIGEEIANFIVSKSNFNKKLKNNEGKTIIDLIKQNGDDWLKEGHNKLLLKL